MAPMIGRSSRALVLGAAAAALVAACYDPGFEPCTIACATSGETCPGGMECSTEGFCVAPGGSCVDTSQPLVRTIAAGDHHVCAIAHGQIYCWGDNSHGQLALPASTIDADPTEVIPPTSGPGQWISLAAGRDHTCAQFRPNTAAGDEIVCWGDNSALQLGNRQTGDPAFGGPDVANVQWIAIGAGEQHSCAVGQDATTARVIYCWGDDTAGQLDGVPAASRAEPVAVVGLTPGAAWRMVDGGARHTCATSTDGEVACWGDNTVGQLGRAAAGPAPQPVDGNYALVAAGGDHTCAILRAGSVACWGDNTNGRLGTDATIDALLAPTGVSANGEAAGWSSLAASATTTCGILGGETYCWGDDGLLQGLSTLGARQLAPTTAVDNGPVATDLAATTVGACAQSQAGVACWGDSPSGELGDGTRTIVRAATEVSAPNLRNWISVKAGVRHTCAVARTAAAMYETYCWGLSNHAQSGTATNQDLSPMPTLLDSPGLETRTVAVGAEHTCTVRPVVGGSADVQCWGDDSAKQLLGNPGQLITIGSAANPQITADRDYTCVTGSTSHVPQCWGTPDPVPSHASTSAVPVASNQPLREDTVVWGASSGCGIENGGTAVYCFGSEQVGELGNGVAGDPAWPSSMPVTGLTGAIAVMGSGPGRTRCAGPMAGGVTCWGDNHYGQVTPGTPGGMADAAQATVSSILTNLTKAIAVGETHGCAITSVDSVVCWGDYTRGQRTAATSAAASQITNPPATGTWNSISAGGTHTCGIAEGTHLYCWGANTYGQLGVPTISSARSTAGPVAIP